MPPPLARAIGDEIAKCLRAVSQKKELEADLKQDVK